MKNLLEILRKYSLPVLMVAILLLGGLTYKFYSNKSKFSRYLMTIRAEQEKLQRNVDFLLQKSEADEQFIAGNMDSALEEYERISVLFGNEDILTKRRLLRDQIEKENSDQTSREKYRTSELSRLGKTMELRLNESEEKYLSGDSLNNILNLQIEKLNEQVAQLEKDLKKKSAMDKLTFTNLKGNKIKYIGEISNGKARGEGIGLWNTGSIYEGKWVDNLRHGEGKFEWADGERYEGEYSYDKRNGKGIYFWKNGDKYEGSWKDDRRNGYGIVYDREGNIKLKGEWKDDILVQPDKEGS